MTVATSPSTMPGAGELALRRQLRRWRLTSWSLGLLLTALIVWSGVRRAPANPARPLVVTKVANGTADAPLPQAATGESARRANDRLRVVSFNIHSAKGADGRADLLRTARWIGDCDLAALYEVRSHALATAANQAADLGQQLHMESVFGATERYWWHEHFGNAVLIRNPPVTVQRVPFPGTRGKAFRNALWTQLRWHDDTVQVLSVHVDREQDRALQLQQVISLFLGLRPPALLMGDLNTTADDPQIIQLLEHPEVTSPLHKVLGDRLPAGTIDWIFTRGLHVASAELVPNDASDHPVLRAEFSAPPVIGPER